MKWINVKDELPPVDYKCQTWSNEDVLILLGYHNQQLTRSSYILLGHYDGNHSWSINDDDTYEGVTNEFESYENNREAKLTVEGCCSYWIITHWMLPEPPEEE